MRPVWIGLSVVLVVVCPASAQDADDFVGTWDLVAIESRSSTGDWVPMTLPFGNRPAGVLMYDGLGNMAVQIATNPRNTLTPGGTNELVNGYIAYYGTYDVDFSARTVTHRRRNHLNPQVAELSVVRSFDFEGDVLTLTVAPEGTVRLRWTRAR